MTLDDYDFTIPSNQPSIDQYVIYLDGTEFHFDREVDGVFIFKDADGHELHYGPTEKIMGGLNLWQPGPSFTCECDCGGGNWTITEVTRPSVN